MLDVIYDGRCGFCLSALRVCRALDVGSNLRYHDANARQQVHGQFPELTSADFDNAMFVVAPDRRVSRGFFAFRRILLESPLMWPLLLLFYFPGSGVIGPRIYTWVAKNRRSFGCASDACELPSTGQRPLD